jgi:ribose-phosphate pyrophosphokinase
VSTALLDRCTNIHVKDLIEPVSNNEYDYLVSPDAGANKKVFALSQAMKIPMIRADKIRDTATGNIIDTQVYTTKEQIEGKRLLIVDDICAGGRTFKELAQKLKSIANCNIDLYVTHGFFNNSIDVINSILASGISYIHTSNNPYKLKHQRLENV